MLLGVFVGAVILDDFNSRFAWHCAGFLLPRREVGGAQLLLQATECRGFPASACVSRSLRAATSGETASTG